MRWSGKLAVVALVASLSLPTAYTFQQAPVVSGHTTYANMDGLDPCVAGIVGIVRLRVMWFNDQVLFERSANEGSSFIYAVQSGSPDPRDATLVPTGNDFAFTDPNGIDWQVKEYNFTVAPFGHVDAGKYSTDPNNPGHPVNVDRTPGANVSTDPRDYYTWVVQTGPTTQDYAASGRSYNFVDLVDTCKFTSPGQAVTHTKDSSGNWTSSWGNDTTQDQHLPTDGSHGHDEFSVDLYVGKAPKVMAVTEQNPDYLGVPQ